MDTEEDEAVVWSSPALPCLVTPGLLGLLLASFALILQHVRQEAVALAKASWKAEARGMVTASRNGALCLTCPQECWRVLGSGIQPGWSCFPWP